ncbi:MAG: hypothetical protein JNM19_01885 [Chitinophagaceae bacterium]|nr:hypothetical protein [Chitinophagaceae bacterium]
MTATGTPAGRPKSEIKAMRILCSALIAGVVMFALVSVGVLQVIEGPILPENELPDKNIFLYVAAGFGALGLLLAVTRFNKRLTVIRQVENTVTGKLSQYRSALIIYMALCEAPALFSVIVLFLTRQYAVLGITAVMLVAMISMMPQKKKLIDTLQLDWQDQQELE